MPAHALPRALPRALHTLYAQPRPGRLPAHPASVTYGCSLYCMRLQPLSHTVAASTWATSCARCRRRPPTAPPAAPRGSPVRHEAHPNSDRNPNPNLYSKPHTNPNTNPNTSPNPNTNPSTSPSTNPSPQTLPLTRRAPPAGRGCRMRRHRRRRGCAQQGSLDPHAQHTRSRTQPGHAPRMHFPASAPAPPHGAPGGPGRCSSPETRERATGRAAAPYSPCLVPAAFQRAPTPLSVCPAGLSPLPCFLRNQPCRCLLLAATEETARFCGVEPRVLRGLPHDVMLATGWESAADEVVEWCRAL